MGGEERAWSRFFQRCPRGSHKTQSQRGGKARPCGSWKQLRAQLPEKVTVVWSL